MSLGDKLLINICIWIKEKMGNLIGLVVYVIEILKIIL